MDTIWRMGLAGSLWWRLSLNGPSEVALAVFPGWSLVTPVGRVRMGQLEDDDRLFRTCDELFGSQRELFLRYRGPEVPDDVYFETATHILALLRFVARQQTAPRSIASATQINPLPYNEVPGIWEPVRKMPGMYVQGPLLQCAITDASLTILAQLAPGFSVPVHATVLLDSLDAQAEQDYRKCILFAAIAVESLASAYLEDAYTESLGQRRPEHRIISLPLPGGRLQHKDPVYEILASGDNFSRLLHERPLYLKGRSLLLDSPDTYRQALALYKTRNKIAHKGTPPDGEEYLSLSADGAKVGLTVAIEVFRWFGDPGPYKIWGQLVSFD